MSIKYRHSCRTQQKTHRVAKAESTSIKSFWLWITYHIIFNQTRTCSTNRNGWIGGMQRCWTIVCLSKWHCCSVVLCFVVLLWWMGELAYDFWLPNTTTTCFLVMLVLLSSCAPQSTTKKLEKWLEMRTLTNEKKNAVQYVETKQTIAYFLFCFPIVLAVQEYSNRRVCESIGAQFVIARVGSDVRAMVCKLV